MVNNNKDKKSVPAKSKVFKLKTPTDVEEKSISVVVNGFVSGTKRPKKVLGIKDIGFNPIYTGAYTTAVIDQNTVKFDDNEPIKVNDVYFYVDKRQHIKYSNGKITIACTSTRPVIVAENGKRRIVLFIQRNDMANIVSNVIGDVVADN